MRRVRTRQGQADCSPSAAMGDHNIIQHFVDVTGADETTATHLLEASAYDLEQAINLFVETGGIESAAAPSAASRQPAVTLAEPPLSEGPATAQAPEAHTSFAGHAANGAAGGEEADYEAAIAASLRDAGETACHKYWQFRTARSWISSVRKSAASAPVWCRSE